MEQVLDLRPEELGCRPEGIAVLAQLASVVLDVPLLFLRDRKLCPLEEMPDVRSRLDLPRVRASDIMDERLKGARRSEQSFRPHGRADVCEHGKMDGIVQCERRNRCRECSAVENTQVLLGGKGDWLNAMRSEGLVGRDNLAVAKLGWAVEYTDGRVANQRPGDV